MVYYEKATTKIKIIKKNRKRKEFITRSASNSINQKNELCWNGQNKVTTKKSGKNDIKSLNSDSNQYVINVTIISVTQERNCNLNKKTVIISMKL